MCIRDRHYPFPTNNQIVSISTGVIGDDKVNCHNAKEIGLQSMEKIIGEKFNNLKFKRANGVLSPVSYTHLDVYKRQRHH